jgi:hypothetical protein
MNPTLSSQVHQLEQREQSLDYENRELKIILYRAIEGKTKPLTKQEEEFSKL